MPVPRRSSFLSAVNFHKFSGRKVISVKARDKCSSDSISRISTGKRASFVFFKSSLRKLTIWPKQGGRAMTDLFLIVRLARSEQSHSAASLLASDFQVKLPSSLISLHIPPTVCWASASLRFSKPSSSQNLFCHNSVLLKLIAKIFDIFKFDFISNATYKGYPQNLTIKVAIESE